MVQEITGLPPTFALTNAIFSLLNALDSRKVIHYLGRCTGWVAHSIEQYQAGEINTPNGSYTGALPATAGIPDGSRG